VLKSANNTNPVCIVLTADARATIIENDGPRVVIAVLRGRPIPITRYIKSFFEKACEGIKRL